MFSRTGSSIFPQSFQLEMEAYRVQDCITRAEKEYLSNSASSSYINDEKSHNSCQVILLLRLAFKKKERKNNIFSALVSGPPFFLNVHAAVYRTYLMH